MSPATSAAVDLVRAATRIDIGEVPPAFDVQQPGFAVDPDEPTQALRHPGRTCRPRRSRPSAPQAAPLPPAAGLRMPVPPPPAASSTPTAQAAPRSHTPSIALVAHAPVAPDVSALVDNTATAAR